MLDFDPDYMSVIDIKEKFIEDLGFPQLSRVNILEPEKSLKDSLFLAKNDSDIYHVLNFKGHKLDIHFYVEHGIDEPIFIYIIMLIEWTKGLFG